MRIVPAIGLVWLLVGMVGCGPATFVVGVAPGGQRLTETAVQGDGQLGSAKVVIIDVNGMIANANQGGLLSTGDNPVSTLTEMLGAAAADSHVRGVILRINSPGGTVTASDMMYREVMRFKQRTGKPVVVMMMDVAASGGYYLSCAGDYVIAYPTTITGSIGVVLQTLSIKPALAKLGIQAEALVSGPNKAAGSPLETLSDEQKAVLQGLVDEFYTGFTTVVREARPAIPQERWAEVTDGRVFTGRQALELGLVDQVGELRDAFAQAKKLIGVTRADLWVYHRPLDYVGSVYSKAPTHVADGGVEVNLLRLELNGGVPGLDSPAGLYYLWRPDLQ